jgi:ABC-type branched-subunit amino acid transport system substrate-binding protein
MLAALAINQAGSAEPDAVREAMIEVSKTHKALTGDMTLDDDGMRLTQDYGTFIFKDGKLQEFTP